MTPAISIIIPMFNAEKFIAECLESIFAQTFQNFEVIIVDDCSTDKSCEIVEGYQEKFCGKLKLFHTEKNSGDGGLPRNIAIKNSIGEFICFVDNDDAITPTALEELNELAEEFPIDVFYFEKYYRAPDETVTTDKNLLKEKVMKEIISSDEQTFLSDDLAERIYLFSENKISWAPWSFFIRREFLIKNNIEFPSCTCLEDATVVFYLICLAEKILIAPNIFYVWRQRHDSLTKNFAPPLEIMLRRAKSILKLIGILDKFMSKLDFFQKFPAYRYKILELFTRHNVKQGKFKEYLLANPGYELDAQIRKELVDTENAVLISFLFCRMSGWEALSEYVEENTIANLKKEISRQNFIIQQQGEQIEKMQTYIQELKFGGGD